MARSRAREMASKRCLPWSEEQPQMDQEHVMFDAILPEPVVKLFRIDESVASNLHMKMQVKTSSPAPARTLSIKQEPEADVEPEIYQEIKPETEIPVSSANMKVQTDQVSGLRLKMSPSPRTVSIKQEPADHLKQEPEDHLKQEPADHLKQEPADHLKQEPADHLKQEPADHLKQEPEDHLDLNQSVESSLWLKMSSARTVSIKQEPEVEGVEVEIGGPERCKVMYDCTADNEDELDLRKGDIVTIIRKETEAVGWWEGEVNGRRGFFPNNFVTLIPPTDAIQSAITSKPPAPGNHTEYCQVMFDCAADREDELELRKGDIITVISKETEEEGWWEGEVDGRRGFFPSNFVKLITPTDAIQSNLASPGFPHRGNLQSGTTIQPPAQLNPERCSNDKKRYGARSTTTFEWVSSGDEEPCHDASSAPFPCVPSNGDMSDEEQPTTISATASAARNMDEEPCHGVSSAPFPCVPSNEDMSDEEQPTTSSATASAARNMDDEEQCYGVRKSTTPFECVASGDKEQCHDASSAPFPGVPSNAGISDMPDEEQPTTSSATASPARNMDDEEQYYGARNTTPFEFISSGDMSDEEQPTTSSATASAARNMDVGRPSGTGSCPSEWWDTDWEPKEVPFTAKPGPRGAAAALHDDAQPVEFFQLFLTDELLKDIVVQTNLYAEQCICMVSQSQIPPDWEWKDVTVAELKSFLGLYFLTGIVKKPELDTYWSTDELIATLHFGRTMTLNRFRLLNRFLHFNNNGSVNEDRFFKVRPVLDYLVAKFRELYTPHENICIDEGILLWRDRLAFILYNPQKPVKYGIKSYILCDSVTGYCYSMKPYCGQPSDLGETVEFLLGDLAGCGYKMYMDNYYNSVKLSARLLDLKTHSCGTLRKNRGEPRAINVTNLKIGETIMRHNGTSMVLAWCDKKILKMVSTIHQNKMQSMEVKQKGSRVSACSTLTLLKPKCVVDYNKYMKGVDKLDRNISYYPFTRKSSKWTNKFVMYLFQMSLYNSYVIYKAKTPDPPTLMDYILSIVNTWTNGRPVGDQEVGGQEEEEFGEEVGTHCRPL